MKRPHQSILGRRSMSSDLGSPTKARPAPLVIPDSANSHLSPVAERNDISAMFSASNQNSAISSGQSVSAVYIYFIDWWLSLCTRLSLPFLPVQPQTSTNFPLISLDQCRNQIRESASPILRNHSLISMKWMVLSVACKIMPGGVR